MQDPTVSAAVYTNDHHHRRCVGFWSAEFIWGSKEGFTNVRNNNGSTILIWIVNFLDFELNELLIFVCLCWIIRDEDRHEHEKR